ncbi:hypothetical protein PHMEG_00028134 [Phytophthora megakarya]|uniref:Eukaryotic/viral aspartic protease n=1 Tax=Phytophthora megakarya TaxID=4795 RepID=A0A225V872_9STRA|nr:hypothetical protein PHMEG_00028134 [Phytophthora megakarya]
MRAEASGAQGARVRRQRLPATAQGLGCSRATSPKHWRKWPVRSWTLMMMGLMAQNRRRRLGSSLSTGFRLPINGDTPGADKVISKTLELMMTKSSWMQMLGPTLVRQAVWMNLGGELVVPIDSTSTRQVVQDTGML